MLCCLEVEFFDVFAIDAMLFLHDRKTIDRP